MTHILQPQRDIDREKGRERESARERERGRQRKREREREQGLLLLVLRHYIIISQDNLLKMYYRQTRQVVSRQYITSTKR